jgi:hypothetical protein
MQKNSDIELINSKKFKHERYVIQDYSNTSVLYEKTSPRKTSD